MANQRWQDEIIQMFRNGEITADQMAVALSGQAPNQGGSQTNVPAVVEQPRSIGQMMADEVARRKAKILDDQMGTFLDGIARAQAAAEVPQIFPAETPKGTHKEKIKRVVSETRDRWGRPKVEYEEIEIDVPDNPPSGQLLLPPAAHRS